MPPTDGSNLDVLSLVRGYHYLHTVPKPSFAMIILRANIAASISEHLSK